MINEKPIPAPDPVSQGYWEAAQGRCLKIQRCSSCRRFQHPPYPFCTNCGSEELKFEEVTGQGRIVTFVIMRDSPIPGFTAGDPFVFAVVELAEQRQLFMQTNVVGPGCLELRVGEEVRIGWEERGDFVMPQFELEATGRTQ
jgi:uncharacterized protein